jgi:hypothetical protein
METATEPAVETTAVPAAETETTTKPDSPSLEQRVREALGQLAPAGARTAAQFAEELAILKRWYYRTHKVGEIVLAKADGELSVRRIANAINRVCRGEKPETTKDTNEHEGRNQLSPPRL